MNVLTTTTRRVSGMACLLLAAMNGSASALDDGQARHTLDPAPAPNHPEAPANATSLTWNQPEAQARATPDLAPCAATAGTIHPPGLPCGYEVEVIKGPNHPNFGYPIMYPQGLNEAGWVVGYFTWTSNFHGFYWSPDEGGVVLSPPAPYNNVFANDINDNNQIVGDLSVSSGIWRGFVYDIDTSEWTILEPIDPDGTGSCWANAINNAGVVAGSRSIGATQQPYNAFIWSADDGYTDLGVMQKGANSEARSINERRAVTGATGPGTNHLVGYIHDGEKTEIVGPIPGGTTSLVHSVNTNGTAVGGGWNFVDGTPEWHRAMTYYDGKFTHLDPLPGLNNSNAWDVSNDGIVVGHSSTWPGPGVQYYATIWHNEIPYDPVEMIESSINIELTRARAINSSGQILSRGNIDGSSAGFLLTPIETPLGDLNGDREVGGEDLGILLSEWGNHNSPADLTGDGTVGGADLGVLLSNWTQ